MADNGGAFAALKAYENWLETHEDHLLPWVNYNSFQLFFIGLAAPYCYNMRPSGLRKWITEAPHALPELRINYVLSNLPEFSKTFGCLSGVNFSSVQKPEGCKFW